MHTNTPVSLERLSTTALRQDAGTKQVAVVLTAALKPRVRKDGLYVRKAFFGVRREHGLNQNSKHQTEECTRAQTGKSEEKRQAEITRPGREKRTQCEKLLLPLNFSDARRHGPVHYLCCSNGFQGRRQKAEGTEATPIVRDILLNGPPTQNISTSCAFQHEMRLPKNKNMELAVGLPPNEHTHKRNTGA